MGSSALDFRLRRFGGIKSPLLCLQSTPRGTQGFGKAGDFFLHAAHTTPGSPAKVQPPGDLEHVQRDVRIRSKTSKTNVNPSFSCCSSPLPRTKNQYTLCAGFSFCAREGARTGRRHLCRKQSHSAALLSLRVPINRNVYQGCTHFVPVSFCAREQTSNNTIYYIKESAMNSENSSRFFSYAGSGGRTIKND